MLLLSALFPQVSWARRRDWHVLTSGRQVYTADERFQILRRPTENQTAEFSGSGGGLANGNKISNNKSEWILQIQFVQPRDGGFYICQVSCSHSAIWFAVSGTCAWFSAGQMSLPSSHFLLARRNIPAFSEPINELIREIMTSRVAGAGKR